MRIKKIVGPIALVCLTSLTANASNLDSNEFSTDFYYTDIKIGSNISTTIQGNSDLQSVTPNTTYIAGFSAGRKFLDRFGAEFEYFFRGKSSIDSSNTSSNIASSNSWSAKANTFMFNFTTDLVIDSKIRPYVKLGAGLSMNKSGQYKQTTGSGNDITTNTWNGSTSNHFAWQAGFGLAMHSSKSIETKIEYAFVDRGEFKTKTGSTTLSDGETTINSNVAAKTGKLRDHVIMLAVGYKF